MVLEPVGRGRPGLYADIPAPVLKVPAGDGESLEEDEEEKNEDDNDKKEMEGKRRDHKFYRSSTWILVFVQVMSTE